jgi:hypothetical protein
MTTELVDAIIESLEKEPEKWCQCQIDWESGTYGLKHVSSGVLLETPQILYAWMGIGVIKNPPGVDLSKSDRTNLVAAMRKCDHWLRHNNNLQKQEQENRWAADASIATRKLRETTETIESH